MRVQNGTFVPSAQNQGGQRGHTPIGCLLVPSAGVYLSSFYKAGGQTLA
jgi:hypothetical protein